MSATSLSQPLEPRRGAATGIPVLRNRGLQRVLGHGSSDRLPIKLQWPIAAPDGQKLVCRQDSQYSWMCASAEDLLAKSSGHARGQPTWRATTHVSECLAARVSWRAHQRGACHVPPWQGCPVKHAGCARAGWNQLVPESASCMGGTDHGTKLTSTESNAPPPTFVTFRNVAPAVAFNSLACDALVGNGPLLDWYSCAGLPCLLPQCSSVVGEGKTGEIVHHTQSQGGIEAAFMRGIAGALGWLLNQVLRAVGPFGGHRRACCAIGAGGWRWPGLGAMWSPEGRSG